MSGTWSLLSKSSQFSGKGKQVDNYYTVVICSNRGKFKVPGRHTKGTQIQP